MRKRRGTRPIGSLAAAIRPHLRPPPARECDLNPKPARLSARMELCSAEEILMRIPALAVLTTVTVLTAAPAVAQRYDANYPVCLQSYGLGGGYNNDCS